jgi:threonine dehydratase
VVTFADIERASSVLEGVAHRTPVVTSSAVTEWVGAKEVFLKCENFQRVGAFKFRGAYNALSNLVESVRVRGVLTYSSGNHAQAVALSGRLLGITTVIVMPSDAPEVKKRATRGYLGPGSEVIEYNRAQTTREELGGRIASERRLTIVPPYDHPDVIAGQGTCAKELFEEVGELDALFVCCGGGGLLSGGAIAARALSPGCAVVGVEPEAGDDATRSFESRTLCTVSDPPTIADGARTPFLGRWTFPLVLANVDRMLTVPDSDLVEAMRLCFERMRIVIEPTGGLGLCGARKAARGGTDIPLRDARIGVIVSGGNVDLSRFCRLTGDR